MSTPALVGDARRGRRRAPRVGLLLGVLTTLLGAALVGAALVPPPSRDTLPRGGAWGARHPSPRAPRDTVVRVSALLARGPVASMTPTRDGVIARWTGGAAHAVRGVTAWTLRVALLVAATLAVARLALLPALALAERRRARRARRARAAARAPAAHPSVSVVVAAHGGAAAIVPTLHSLRAQRWPGTLEVLVIDDGPSGDTAAAAMAAAGGDPRVHVYRKPDGGRASALNFALAHATGELLALVEAGTRADAHAVAGLAAPFADARVGAVSGRARVADRATLVARCQAADDATMQGLERRAFTRLGGVTVVPGAAAAWRTDAVRAVGGFAGDTRAADQDLTLRLRRVGWRVAHADDAVALIDPPAGWRAFLQRRCAASLAALSCAWKHRDALGRDGTLGWLALPALWLLQLLYGAVSPLADLRGAWTIVAAWRSARVDGTPFAFGALRWLAAAYAVFLLADWLVAVLALALADDGARDEARGLGWLVAVQRLASRQAMYAVVAHAARSALRGRARAVRRAPASVARPA